MIVDKYYYELRGYLPSELRTRFSKTNQDSSSTNLQYFVNAQRNSKRIFLVLKIVNAYQSHACFWLLLMFLIFTENYFFLIFKRVVTYNDK